MKTYPQRYCALFAMMLAGMLTSQVFAAPGDLDPSFGVGGKVTFSPSGWDDPFGKIALQPDGKIVVVGGVNPTGIVRDFEVVRFNPDGSLDSSFGTGGVVTTPVGSNDDVATSVVVQTDGKILVAGFAVVAGQEQDFALVRYNSNGSLDTSFGTGGKVITDFAGTADTSYDMALLSDGKIILAGTTWGGASGYDSALARFNADGTLDTSFGTGGKVIAALSPQYDFIYSIAIQPDGKIIAGGDYWHPNGFTDFALSRFNANGTLDTTFGPGGTVHSNFGSSSAHCSSVVVLGDGRIVGGGRTTIGGYYDFLLASYNANGSTDVAFGGGTGVVRTDFGLSDQCGDVVVQADGKLVAGGYVGNGDSTLRDVDFALARFNADGTPDSIFGNAGKVITQIGTDYDSIGSIALQSDGRIVVGGAFTGVNGRFDWGFARYEGGAPPEIVVEQPAGNERPDGSGTAIYFGTVAVGGNASLVFTIKNTDVGDLTGLGITFDGPDPSMFSVTVAPVAPVTGPAGSTTFTVKYAPTAAGSHSAYLHLSSNDSDESPYDLLLVGSTMAPDIAVYDTAFGGPEITNGQPGAISFGTTPVGTPVNHTFAVYNMGGGVIQCGAITVPAGFSIFSAPSQMPPGGGVGLVIRLTAAAPGVYSGSVSIGSNDPDENPFTFPITGTVTGGSMPAPVSSALGDIVTASGAPDAGGTASIGAFDVLRRGGYLAENGNIVFPGSLLIGSGTPPVSLSPNTFMGLWKDTGKGAKLFARSGDAAPEAGGALFDVLPQVPAINDSGEVTFLASLATNPSSTPPTTTDNDTGLWSELGGTGTGILIREGDTIPGLAPLQVGAFASGCYATAHTSASTGEAAFCVMMKNGNTDTAILRTSITGPTVTAVQVVARENNSAPGTAELFGNLAGTYTDALRMDATGNLAFVALTKTSKESLWYQPVGGATAKVFLAGETAPGTSGATFKNIKTPAIGSGGVISFRGLLNNDGDTAAGLKNDGIWRGTGSNAASYACILRRGDTAVAGLPVGSKVGNLWNSWLTNANHGAWKGWLDVDGNGTSAAPTDVYAIYSDLSGTMSYVLKVGDAVPGIAGATFASFDLPVVGGVEQMAFIGIVTGGGTTGANNSGIWRSAPNGGALTLVIRTGGTVTTTQGVKTIKKVDFPGSGTTDRRWEQPVMDSTGRLIVLVTFTDGSTSQVLAP